MNLADCFAALESAPAPAEPTPAERARLAAKRAAEFARGVALGWHDSDGNPLPGADATDESDELDSDESDE